MSDVRKTLPKGVNDADMNERGERRGAMANYGDPYDQKTVYAIFRAWGVKKWWLVNHTGSWLRDGVPTVSNEGGPAYMLLFADGKWRYAKFGGVNGPPWTYCPWEGWEAPNGQTAYLQWKLEAKIESRAALLDKVKAAEAEIVKLGQELSAAAEKPERSDETWKGS